MEYILLIELYVHTRSQGIPLTEMHSSISATSLGLSGCWSSLKMPGLSSPEMSCSKWTSEKSLRSDMEDTFRLDRTESDLLKAAYQRKTALTITSALKQNVKQRQHSKDESREVLTFRIGIAPFPMTPTQFEAPPLEGSRVTHGAAAQQVRATLRQPPVPFLVVCILLQCNQYV